MYPSIARLNFFIPKKFPKNCIIKFETNISPEKTRSTFKVCHLPTTIFINDNGVLCLQWFVCVGMSPTLLYICMYSNSTREIRKFIIGMNRWFTQTRIHRHMLCMHDLFDTTRGLYSQNVHEICMMFSQLNAYKYISRINVCAQCALCSRNSYLCK